MTPSRAVWGVPLVVYSLVSCPSTAVRRVHRGDGPLGEHHFEDTFDHRDDKSEASPATGPLGVPHFEDTFDHRDDKSKASPASSFPAPEVYSAALSSSIGPICAQPTGRRVVSIADQHGDFDGLLLHLQALGLVKSAVSRQMGSWGDLWIGGNAIFVQTGDVLDRGQDGQLMYRFLWALQDQAKSQGGEVVLLVGNHELMVLQGDIRYVTNRDFCSYTSDNCGRDFPRQAQYCSNSNGNCCTYANGMCQTNSTACMPGNCEFLQAWDKDGEMGSELRTRFGDGRMKLVHQQGDIVFTHAGLVSSLWDKIGGGKSLDELNNQARQLFTSHDGRSLWDSDHIVAGGTGQNGPLWTRVCFDNWYTASGRRRSGSNPSLYIDSDEKPRVKSDRCADIAESLERISAKRMVIGHCPTGSGIQTDCSGSLVMADTYMSIAYAGSRSKATENQAALEFYTKATHKLWIVYSGNAAGKTCKKVGKLKSKK